jgi:hypothetical protein
MYTFHRIRPGYWIIRNLYGERIAECETRRQAMLIIGSLAT